MTNERTTPSWALVGLIAVVAFAAGVLVHGGGDSPTGDGAAHDHGAAEVWTCSMHPQVERDAPGACPICGMDLVPRETTPTAAQGETTTVRLSPRARALARVRTEPVVRMPSSNVELRLLGRVEYDEGRLREVTAWTAGRIDRLHVRVTGEEVRRGQVIASLYSPELYAAQQDLIAAERQVARTRNALPAVAAAAEATRDATRQRLRLLGVPSAEIDRMRAASRPRRQVSVRSPASGTIIAREATQGAYVQTGAVLYRIADLSRVWVVLDAYERDLATLSVGQTVRVEVDALPGQRFDGAITFIDPTLDARRRVTRVRVEVDNPDGALRPGMFAQSVVRASQGADRPRPLTIPHTAALFTGRRSLVYVEAETDHGYAYTATTVRLGPRMGDRYPVVAGLSEGLRVVTHGAFAIDADLQIRGGEGMMQRPDDTQTPTHDELVDTSPEFLSGLTPIVEAYLAMQSALAADAWNDARAAAAQVSDAVGRFSPEGRSDAADAWERLRPALLDPARAAAEASSIEDARAAFERLSAGITELLRRFGNPTEQTLRQAHCPMAFGNRGAEWVQRGDVIDNAYFGEVMRTCGAFRQELAPGQHLMPAAP